MHIWKQKIVWSENNGCHVPQEDVCKVLVAYTLLLLTRIVKYRFLSRCPEVYCEVAVYPVQLFYEW